MTEITISSLTKKFGDTVAVDAVDLHVKAGDLFFLLGPSGCGKTTLLRMLAGFAEPTAGSIRFGEQDVTHLSPNKRNVGMVFQSYALWPHMTVFDNVAYGLSVRKIGSSEKSERVMAALASVQMQDYARRKPNQLSGGQQQRVALARALVIQPTVLLLDEPLSNLDAKLRLEMRSEIRRLCKATGITTVYVTHDQKEALSMADQVALLRDGKRIQVGPPRELYERPASRFVAEFLGETNFLTGRIAEVNGESVLLDTPAGRLACTTAATDTAGLAVGREVTCSIRPEALRPCSSDEHNNVLTGTRRDTVYLGEMAQHIIDLADDVAIKVLELSPGRTPGPENRVHLHVRPEDVVIVSN